MIRSAAGLLRRAERCQHFADQLDLCADLAALALPELAGEYEAAASVVGAHLPPRSVKADIPKGGIGSETDLHRVKLIGLRPLIRIRPDGVGPAAPRS